MNFSDLLLVGLAAGVGYLIWQHMQTPAPIVNPAPALPANYVPANSSNIPGIGTIGALGSCSYVGLDGKTYQGYLGSGFSGKFANMNMCTPQVFPA